MESERHIYMISATWIRITPTSFEAAEDHNALSKVKRLDGYGVADEDGNIAKMPKDYLK